MTLLEKYEEMKQRGLEEGLEQGLEQGREEGKEEVKVKTALKLIKKGMSADEIMDLTELSKEKVQELIASHKE